MGCVLRAASRLCGGEVPLPGPLVPFLRVPHKQVGVVADQLCIRFRSNKGLYCVMSLR